MKFYCVTPCLNAEKYIEETMLSVLQQTVFEQVEFSLCYVIADGGSADGTVGVINRISSMFSHVDNIEIVFFSEKDSGMYDALVKGFLCEKGASDVYSYINAGDFYSKNAFEIVSDIFSKNSVHFLTGINVVYNEKSHLVSFMVPYSYCRYNVLKGFHGKILPHIQQESTFWTNRLHQEIDFNILKTFKYAGDYFLWKTFIYFEQLYVVNAWIGGFKIHGGQLSSQFATEYVNELSTISQKKTVLDYFFAFAHKILWNLPVNVRDKFALRLFEYDHFHCEYRLNNNPLAKLIRFVSMS